MSLIALQQDFRSLLTVEAPDAAERLGGRGTPGLAVYINNYRGQLMACLADTYPVLRAWLGEKAFDRAAATHVDRSPPRSWTLDDYALDYPETLADLFGADPEVAELAELERNLSLAFIGPDVPPIDIASIGELDWDNAIIEFVPTLSLHPFKTNAAEIWQAIQAGETPPPAASQAAPCLVAIWRHNFTPTFRMLDSLESRAMEMASEKVSFGEICTMAVEAAGPAQGARAIGEYLAEWLRAGLIRSICSERA